MAGFLKYFTEKSRMQAECVKMQYLIGLLRMHTSQASKIKDAHTRLQKFHKELAYKRYLEELSRALDEMHT